QGAGADGANGFNMKTVGEFFKIPEDFECCLNRLWVQFAALENFTSQAHRLAVLFNDAVVFGLIDDRHLAAHSVAADVDHCEVLCHRPASYHKPKPIKNYR